MPRKVILTCAVTGNAPFNPKHPNFPVTPAQICDAVVEAAGAGASRAAAGCLQVAIIAGGERVTAFTTPELPEGADPLIAPSRNPQFGDFQSNCAMGLAKSLGVMRVDDSGSVVGFLEKPQSDEEIELELLKRKEVLKADSQSIPN